MYIRIVDREDFILNSFIKIPNFDAFNVSSHIFLFAGSLPNIP